MIWNYSQLANSFRGFSQAPKEPNSSYFIEADLNAADICMTPLGFLFLKINRARTVDRFRYLGEVVQIVPEL